MEVKGEEVTDLESAIWEVTVLCDTKPSLLFFSMLPLWELARSSSAMDRIVKYREKVQVLWTLASGEG